MSAERELLKRVRDTLLELKETHYDLYWDIQTALDLREDLREGLREEITLRDHFAGLAMQGVVVSRPTWEDTRRIALTSYEQADAMLAERGEE
jgi:hypothetical protein